MTLKRIDRVLCPICKAQDGDMVMMPIELAEILICDEHREMIDVINAENELEDDDVKIH